MSDKVLIVGISGQTGAYLANALIRSGKTVVGTSRNLNPENLWRLSRFGIREDVSVVPMSPQDFHSTFSVLREISPDIIYFLGGQSSVGLSFEQPYETFESIVLAVTNILECIRISGLDIAFVNSASTDMFGDHGRQALSEVSAMRPVSPYGVAKAASYWTTVQYRQAFGIRALNAILTNHESPLRGPNFVSAKITTQVHEILSGNRTVFEFGNVEVSRDWLWAGDVARALVTLSELTEPSDFIVASGRTHTLRDLITAMAQAAGIRDSIEIRMTRTEFRPQDIETVQLNPEKIHGRTSWVAEVEFEELARRLVAGQM